MVVGPPPRPPPPPPVAPRVLPTTRGAACLLLPGGSGLGLEHTRLCTAQEIKDVSPFLDSKVPA